MGSSFCRIAATQISTTRILSRFASRPSRTNLSMAQNKTAPTTMMISMFIKTKSMRLSPVCCGLPYLTANPGRAHLESAPRRGVASRAGRTCHNATGLQVRHDRINHSKNAEWHSALSRRAILAGAASVPALALPAAVAVALPGVVEPAAPAPAAAAIEPDPIIAAIAEHRRLYREWSSLWNELDGPEGKVKER
jgi:hypothetical protein